MDLPLLLTMGGPSLPPCENGSAIIYDHGRPPYHHVRMALHLYLTMGGPAYHHVRMSHPLHLIMGGPAYHHVRMAHILITSSWKEPQYGEHQASP